MIALLPISFAILAVAGVIGAVDGVYYHLWKYRLYARPASRLEHAVHTLRALLLPLTLWFGYAVPRSLDALVLFGAIELCDFVFVVWDVSIEHKSRAEIGGLSRNEYLVHVVAGTLHSGAVALALATWPVAAWALQPVADPVAPPAWVASLAQAAVPGGALIALAHLVLLHPRFRSAAQEVAALGPAR